MRILVVAPLVGAMLGLLCGSAVALPAAPDAGESATGGQSAIVQVHGCHRDVLEGRGGWHYHRGPYCDRIAVPPPRRRYDEYRERRDFREHRGPRCFQECKYIGPIKVCKEKCH